MPASCSFRMAMICSSVCLLRFIVWSFLQGPDSSSLWISSRGQRQRKRGRYQAVRRREVITLLGGAAAWPYGARAQQGERVRRVGVLMYWGADDAEGRARLAALTQALQQSGWSEGRNLRIDPRFATDADELRRHATELLALAP